MLNRIIVVALVALLFTPAAPARAVDSPEIGAPPVGAGAYNARAGEPQGARAQARRAPYPMAARSSVKAQDTSAAGAERCPELAEGPVEAPPFDELRARAQFCAAPAVSTETGRVVSRSARPAPQAWGEGGFSQSSRDEGAIAPAATCTVTTLADSGAGSLRECLSQAAAAGTILFDPAVFPPAAPATITLASALPVLRVDGLTVDGSDAGVVLDGSQLAAGAGLEVAAVGRVTVRGLQVRDFPWEGIALTQGTHDCVIGGDRGVGAGPLGQGNLLSGNSNGIWLEGPDTTGNRIQGNFIGTDLAGTGVLSNTVDGIVLLSGADDNLVGGETPGLGNLISGNGRIGVNVNADCAGNRVLGNVIGLAAGGATALGNGESGVFIGFGAHDTVVGGTTTAARNLIGGNGLAGVLIKDAGTTANRVAGNIIGANAAVTAAVSNAVGVFIGYSATGNTIGGDTAAAGNLISGNAGSGVWIEDTGTTGNEIAGNRIGIDATGTGALGNGGDGVTLLRGASSNVVGDATAGAGNLISGNGGAGVWIQDLQTDDNQVLGNIIGADITGAQALGNGEDGIVIKNGAGDTIVGGETASAGNLISGNGMAGVWIEDADTAGNRVLGNRIGTDGTGMRGLGNAEEGIVVSRGAHETVIGGETPSAANIISANRMHGIMLQLEDTDDNRIVGNIIGANAAGTQALVNGYTGVFIGFAASDNIVGGETAGARNLINGSVWLQEQDTTGNQVLGNFVGTDGTGARALGNRSSGVVLISGASGNVVGGKTPAARNIISGNAEYGVLLQDSGTAGNEITGNYIGTDVAGAYAVGNGLSGVAAINGAAGNLIGGGGASARNLVSGNGWYGVELEDEDTSNNRVQGNYIGTDASGAHAIANAIDGVVIAFGAGDNLVGGATPGLGNLISGNALLGVNIGEGAADNRVQGNIIGMDATGARALGNGQMGVHIGFGAYDNVVGGETLGMRNLISGNEMAGVLIKNPGTAGNRLLGNVIGLNLAGTTAVPNLMDGVAIAFGASANVVGGETAGAGNVISGNGQSGVWIQNTGTVRNRVVGNTIGDAADGALGNGDSGVVFTDGSTENTLGPGNTIAHNGGAGVTVDGPTTLRNTITRNLIHHNGGAPIDFVGMPQPAGPVGAPDLVPYVDVSRTLTGAACAGCRVEVFANPDAQPAGTIYLAAATADTAGAFTLTLSSPPSLPFLHATATDPQGTTSEFSTGLNTNRNRIYLPLGLK